MLYVSMFMLILWGKIASSTTVEWHLMMYDIKDKSPYLTNLVSYDI